MIKEYIEKNTAEMVRRLSELVAIPGFLRLHLLKELLLERISGDLWSMS